MHEVLRDYYQKLKNDGFEHAGRIEGADISFELSGEVSPGCFNTDDYVGLNICLSNDLITDIKHQCISDPINNVAIEIICDLAKGKTLQEALQITEDSILQFLGCEDDTMRAKAAAILVMLHKEINEYVKG